MPDLNDRFCMDCGIAIPPSNTTGVCKDCKRESITYVPSPERIAKMAAQIKQENIEKDLAHARGGRHHPTYRVSRDLKTTQNREE